MSFEIFESWLEARIIPGVTTNWEGPDLMPAIVIGAATGFILSKVLTSILPKRGVYASQV
jgi:hypothetical protein